MKIFDVFDKFGNPIGTIETSEPSGEGCLGGMLLLLLGALSVLSWPFFFKELFQNVEDAEQKQLLGQLIFLFLYLGISAGCVIAACFKASFTFLGTWGKTILFTTLIVGAGYWIIAGIVDKETYGFGTLLLSLFFTFLLSIGSGLLCAILSMIIRMIRFRSKRGQNDNERT